jgi:ribokinase
MADGRLVVVGTAAVEEVFRVPVLPLPGEGAPAAEVLRTLAGKGANQAVAARRLEVRTAFVGRVGEDEAARETAEDLARHGVEARLIPTRGAPTARSVLLRDDEGEGLAAVHLGAAGRLEAADVEGLGELVTGASVLLASLDVPPDALLALRGALPSGSGTAVLDARPLGEGVEEVLGRFDVVVLGRAEAEALAGVGIASAGDAMAALRGLSDLGAIEPVVWLGRAGAACFDRGRAVHVPAPRGPVQDARGAADAFVGALAASLARAPEVREAVDTAVRYAALAAGTVEGRSAWPGREALEAGPPAE